MLLSIRSLIGTAAVAAVLLAVILLIVIRMVKNKRAGKSSCSCGCGGCAMRDMCRSKDENLNK